MEKSTPLWWEDCRFVSFETGLGKPMLTLNDPNGLKNSTNVYSIHLELRMALPCQISTGKWKYVNPCLDFLGIPDQRTAYVKRQARPRWTYVRRSSVTLDLTIHHMPILTSACATRPWWVNEWLVIDVGEIFSFLLINNKLGVPGVASYRGRGISLAFINLFNQPTKFCGHLHLPRWRIFHQVWSRWDNGRR